MRPLWVVQTNLIVREDVQELIGLLRRLRIEHVPIEIPAFSQNLPEISHEGPVVAYGAIYFANQVAKSNVWKPGVWQDDSLLNYRAYIQHYGDEMVNHQTEFMTLDEFRQKGHPLDQKFFIRPTADHKQFGGQLLHFGDLQSCFDKANENLPANYSLTWDVDIAVSPPLAIDLEWRVFIVNGRCVTGSQYRHLHHFETTPGLPPAVRSYANAMASKWSPLPVYVMDIGLSNGKLKILELGSFNSAGFYHADKLAIVTSINEILV